MGIESQRGRLRRSAVTALTLGSVELVLLIVFAGAASLDLKVLAWLVVIATLGFGIIFYARSRRGARP